MLTAFRIERPKEIDDPLSRQLVLEFEDGHEEALGAAPVDFSRLMVELFQGQYTIPVRFALDQKEPRNASKRRGRGNDGGHQGAA